MTERAHEVAEILYNDAFFQQCITIIESNVLTREMLFRPQGKTPKKKFSGFIKRYYDPFIRQALRHIYAYGFVAWRIRKLASGDSVPEALPMASFSWVVVPSQNKNDKLLQYKVTQCMCNIKVQDVYVIPVTPPIYNTYAKLSVTPFDSVLTHYKNYKKAEAHAMNADEWNSRAQISHVHNSSQSNATDRTLTRWALDPRHKERFLQEMSVLNADHEELDGYPKYNDNDKIRYYKLREAMEQQMIDHTQINWFPLTDDSQLKQLENLKLNLNMERMYLLYKEAVCYAMGVPTQLVIMNTFTSNHSAEGYNTSSRLFNSSMTNLCRQLSRCLRIAYETIYKEDCWFELSPLNRLEIQSYETLQKLLEMENGIPPHTRKAIMNDLHFQITGEVQRYVIYLVHVCLHLCICMHSTAQAYTTPVRFKVEKPRIKLTKNCLTPATGMHPPNETPTIPCNKKETIAKDKEKIPQKTKQQKIWDNLLLFSQREGIEITATVSRTISSVLLLMLLITQAKNSANYILANTPFVWILPILVKLAKKQKQDTLPRNMTMFFIILFPLWLEGSRKKETKGALSLLTIVVVIIANVNFSSWITWFVFSFLMCTQIALLFIVPQTDMIIHTACVFCIIFMYHYNKHTPA